MATGVVRRGAEYLIQTFAISIVLCWAVNAAPARDARVAGILREPSDIETVRGEVVRVETLPRAGGGGSDVMLVLRTDIGDEVPVAVAPRWVVKAMGLRFRNDDDIQVAGWRIVRGKPALLAAEISNGEQLFVIRDRHGSAVWGRGRRLQRPQPHRVH